MSKILVICGRCKRSLPQENCIKDEKWGDLCFNCIQDLNKIHNPQKRLGKWLKDDKKKREHKD